MKIEDYLFLDIQKAGMIVFAFILAILLHNFIYALFNFEEPVFSILATIIIPLYFLISVIYTIFHHIKRRLKKKR